KRRELQLEVERTAAQEKARRQREEREAAEKAKFDALPDEEKKKIVELEKERERRQEAERQAAEKAYQESLRAMWRQQEAIDIAKRAEQEAKERARNTPDRV